MQKAGKTAVLLINLGTPDSPSVGDVRKYLQEFLMDRRVIDIPYFNRFMLVNGIIAPFRAPKSSKVYHELWDEKGSPLLYFGIEVKALLQEALGKNHQVFFGMRYQNPTLASALKEIEQYHPDRILVLPLFPQYASATTGSAVENFMEIIQTWEVIPEIKIISNFFEHPAFIEAFAENGRRLMEQEDYDHFIFTYHGLPERQIHRSSVGNYCRLSTECCSSYNTKNHYCYRAQCFATTRLLTENLGIPKEKYTVSFQSRLGKTPWIQPYTEDVVKELAAKNCKKILCFSPSFVADCLETTIECGVEYKELFFNNGGEAWQLVPSLNSEKLWIECLKELIGKQ